MKNKLFDYVEKDNIIYNLSGLTKLICFVVLTGAVMFSYDIRAVSFVAVLSIIFFVMSELKFRQVRTMMLYVLIFLLLNFVLTFIFSPTYGTEIYGTEHVLFHITSTRYVVTQEQLLYQITKFFKYASVVPLGMLFLLTTNPSEFAASLNRIGVNYKGAFAVSLTLRYFPDMMRDYSDISLAQQSRGLDLSKKEKLGTRVKNMMNIAIPLLFSTLERIELISNAMDLRGFGKKKKRTWYVAKPMTKADVAALIICVSALLLTIAVSVFINGSRFWNPFV